MYEEIEEEEMEEEDEEKGQEEEEGERCRRMSGSSGSIPVMWTLLILRDKVEQLRQHAGLGS